MKIFQADRPLMVSRHDDETVSSFASRMAARNGAASLPDFCRDVGVNYLRLNSWREEAHRQILSATDQRRAGLIAITPCLIERPFFRFGATRIHYRALVRQQPKYCPECFREDFKRGGLLGPFQRFPWLFTSVRTCRKHGCLLLALPSVKSIKLDADYSRRVTDALGRRGERLGEVVSATSTPLEDYLVGRVLGRRVSEFLDRLDPLVVAETSEALGAAIHFGSSRKVHSLDTQELIDAGAAGFNLLRQGQQVTIDTMDEIRRSQPRASWERVYFRNLLTWLEYRAPKVFEPIREVFRDYFVNTMPVRAGTKFLGKEVSEQKVFTLATAARFAAVDKTKFERYLANRHASIENAGGQPLPPGCVPASVAEEIARRQSLEIDLLEAAKILGVDRNLLARLARAGLLQDSFRNRSNSYRFEREEVEVFLELVLNLPNPKFVAAGEADPIFSAATRFRLRVDEIIILICKGELKPIYPSAKRRSRRSLRDIYINPDDLSAVLKPPRNQGLEPADAAVLLQTDVQTINRLCRAGSLKEARYQVPHIDRHRRYIRAGSLKAFRARYISMKEAAQKANMLPGPYAIHLASLGIEPEKDFPTRTRFYRRKIVG